MTAVSVPRAETQPAVAAHARRRIKPSRVALHGFLITVSIVWFFPIAYAIYTSLRPYSDTAERGYASLPGVLNLDNYIAAFTQGEMPKFFINTVIITVPAVFLVLFLASLIAFAVTRFNWRFNLLLLMIFTAGNLLPPQVLINPLYRMYLAIPVPQPLSDNGLLYDQLFGIMVIHVAFQLGFCAFVLSNYMKTLPGELTEAALVDGASVWQIYYRVILPLCKPALAALATLEVTFIYNDFFWALVLISHGDKRPITSALNNLKGEFFVNNNLVAAGAIIVALPTILVYIVLQRYFIRGLSLGATKG